MSRLANPWLSRVLAVVLLTGVTGCGGLSTVRWTVADSKKAGLRAISFHFKYPGQMRRSAPGKNAYVRLASRRDGELVESVEIAPLLLDGQRGAPSAYLPLLMEDFKEGLRRRDPEVKFVLEGRAKLGDLSGYQLFYETGHGKHGEVYGRLVLLPQFNLKKGVAITALAGPASGFDRATLIGYSGLTRDVFSTFDFGS